MQRTVIGVPQSTAYCSMTGIDLKSCHDEQCDPNLGIPSPEDSDKWKWELLSQMLLTSLYTHIVDVEMLLLLVLAILTELLTVISFADYSITAKDRSWCIDIKSQLGHLYIVCEEDVCFAESEIRRLH